MKINEYEKEVVLKVLEGYADGQTNLSSEAAREMIAEKIMLALQTEWGNRLKSLKSYNSKNEN
tara:strand:+ start:1791 stop:1979 length:189 start_codon:yes stop_codon:yes gene_type:complete